MKLKSKNSVFVGKTIFFAALFCGMMQSASAQISTQNLNGNGDAVNAITTAVPFLLIGPDSRAGAMGDGGVASSADVNSKNRHRSRFLLFEQLDLKSELLDILIHLVLQLAPVLIQKKFLL